MHECFPISSEQFSQVDILVQAVPMANIYVHSVFVMPDVKTRVTNLAGYSSAVYIINMCSVPVLRNCYIRVNFIDKFKRADYGLWDS